MFKSILLIIAADCFSAGLSFKKGLSKLNASGDVDMMHCFTLPPCNVDVAVKQLKKDR